jgi:hypothetical protein
MGLILSLFLVNGVYSQLLNGGFETGNLNNWNVISGGSCGCPYNMNMGVQNGVVYEGIYSANITNPNDPNCRCGYLEQSYDFTGAVNLDAYLRMDDWGYSCSFGESSIEILACNSTNCKSTGNICQDLLDNTVNWRKHSLSLSGIPDNSDKIRFYFKDDSSGWGADVIYLDNVTVEVIPTTTTTTTTTILEERTVGKTIGDIGEGLGGLFSGFSVPLAIFIILMALGSAIGYMFSSFGQNIGKKV